MKILHVREVANVAATLVGGLRQLGHEAELKDVPVPGAKLPQYLKVATLPQRLRDGLAINRYIRDQRPEVVHLHVAYMGWLGILGGYRYFLHGHGDDLSVNMYRPFIRGLTVRSVRSAQRFFYSTPDLRRYVTAVRPDAVFIPNPVDVDRFCPVSQNGGSRPRVLLISRFEKKKGPDVAVQMFRDFKRLHPSVEIDAFRWGPLADRYSDPSLLTLIPTVPYSEMPAFLNRYDAIVGQFTLGIMSMSELEAMACGKPVVSYFAYPEVYDEPPPLFSTTDTKEAAAQLSALIEDAQLRREVGEKGREWVEKHHHYVKVARLLAAEYEAALATSGPGPPLR